MEKKYCWRCKMEVPFLNDDEFTIISDVYSQCLRAVKDYRARTNASLRETPFDEIYQPVKKAYQEITGCKDMHHDEIMHHRLSSLGPDCVHCKKPLRTPRARLCSECWKKKAE